MRDRFVATLKAIARKDKNVVLITGDLGFGVLKSFWEELPDQFINAGISEQAMTSMAAGMAMTGKTIFTYSIGNFPTLRCIEQIRNDCAYHNANVKIVCVGGGFVYGALGMSHHATEDLAMMRAMPNIVVMAPGDLIETECATNAIYEYPGTCYLRLGRGGERRIHNKINDFQIGKAIKIQDGELVVLFSTGAIFDEVQEACNILKKNGIIPAIYTFPTVKPIDETIIRECTERFNYIVTVEEHNIIGGFGSAVAEVMAELPNRKARLLKIGLHDLYSSIVGDQKYLRAYYGMSAKIISEAVKDLYDHYKTIVNAQKYLREYQYRDSTKVNKVREAINE
ncbi:Apulose-4-phosphate transketolase subunit B [Sporomusa silvacetica DSM 10669]|uniref:Apulose-4-phosphate transketolase subunit B n=1 Tax=Sporomusa silvacetica DSM 10669 TaxID=1123289 RepID=A0ABZ3IHU0_9FIRM|nr:transketolase C-terminal domain-containing protein [Sporomusa silvacetica]OZC21444.1 1-deoxy-D-xylulose-5-phosphate synthase [Sporomusa silvacetica DSM 10669]